MVGALELEVYGLGSTSSELGSTSSSFAFALATALQCNPAPAQPLAGFNPEAAASFWLGQANHASRPGVPMGPGPSV